MTSAGGETRDLVPPIEDNPEEITGIQPLFAGNVAPVTEFPPAAIPPMSMQPAVDPQSIEPVHVPQFHGFPEQPAAVTARDPAPVDVSDASDVGRAIPVSIAEDVPAPGHSSTGYGGGGTGGRDHRQDDSDEDRPLAESDGTGAGSGRFPANAGDSADTGDDAHSISVTQIAIADQEASVLVSGYVGEVVARIYIDQDLIMDQDVDISVVIDGDGHFDLLLGQHMRIEQDVEIDIEIFDVDGVLYVDVSLRDSIEIEQDTSVDMRITDGPSGGSVEVNQDIEMEQDVDIDIDIEDELEERYVIKVDVASLQEVDAEQLAVVDVANWNGDIEMDVGALQIAAVEQHTIVQADFSLA